MIDGSTICLDAPVVPPSRTSASDAVICSCCSVQLEDEDFFITCAYCGAACCAGADDDCVLTCC